MKCASSGIAGTYSTSSAVACDLGPMENYYLFRGDQIISHISRENTVMGAGNLHSQGKPGDVLVIMNNGWMMRCLWQKGTPDGRVAAWQNSPLTEDGVQRIRTLILLQNP